MALFDIFKKKDCEICGKEVGMLGYKKLEDGEICKDCVKLLSPWFDDRRHSTVEQIKAQLQYREENKAALSEFRPTLAFGEDYVLRAELVDGVPSRFVVERNGNYREENADIIGFRDVTSFTIDIQDSENELMRENEQGDEVSYNPPRYEYSYDFCAEIHINHPYFDEISFRLNRDSIVLESVGKYTVFDPALYPEYRQFKSKCEELEELFRAGQQGMALEGLRPAAQPAPQAVAEPAPAGPKFCPNCGAPAEGAKFCQSCGSKL